MDQMIWIIRYGSYDMDRAVSVKDMDQMDHTVWLI